MEGGDECVRACLCVTVVERGMSVCRASVCMYDDCVYICRIRKLGDDLDQYLIFTGSHNPD